MTKSAVKNWIENYAAEIADEELEKDEFTIQMALDEINKIAGKSLTYDQVAGRIKRRTDLISRIVRLNGKHVRAFKKA